MTTPTFSLVVPLYNEEERFTEHADSIANFLARFPPGSELIVVDDGSSDRTVALVEEFASRRSDVTTRLIRRPHRGKGAAVRAGLEAATTEYSGFCDVDLSTPLEQLEHVLRAAEMSPVLAIGSRDVATSTLVRPLGPVRTFLGRTYNRLIQLTLVPGISDTQCDAKVASATVWKAILPWCREDGLTWNVEVVAVARRQGIFVREVAVDWSHDDTSRVNLARDGARMLLAVPRLHRRIRTVPPAPRAATAASGVFDEDQAATLSQSDTQHWWFHSKGTYVAGALRRHLPARLRASRLVDIGAGPGSVTAVLGWPPERVFSVDGSQGLCRWAKDDHGVMAAAGVAEALPLPARSVGVVTMLDVIEHLPDPQPALREAGRVLDADGLLVVSVPAHDWLWSRADEVSGHVCRYTQPLLRRQLEGSGFRIIWMSHVFSWLIGPMWLVRRNTADEHRQTGYQHTSELLEVVAWVLTRAERLLAQRVSLPLGTSIFCVASPVGAQEPAPPARLGRSGPPGGTPIR